MKHTIEFVAGDPVHGDWGIPFDGTGREHGVVFATLFSTEAAIDFLKKLPIDARTYRTREVAIELGLCPG